MQVGRDEMPLNKDYLLNLPFPVIEATVSPRAAMLYALSIGLGVGPAELCYVYERELRPFVTLALIVAGSGAWLEDKRTGVTWSHVVHGAQCLLVFEPLPIGIPLLVETRVADVIDKGRGAIIVLERTIRDGNSGAAVARTHSTIICRADGGFEQARASTDQLIAIPARNADHMLSIPSDPRAAMLYRLNQDMNPLHVDHDLARKAGFPRPVLHGLATLGMTIAAASRLWADRDLKSLEARFTGPVYPGDTLQLSIWEGQGVAHFRVNVAERDSVVLDYGRLVFG
jgi:acyl dehydratase